MQILIILIAAAVGWALAGRLGVSLIETPSDVGAYALATMLLFTASAHFSKAREDLVAMVPPRLPAPKVLVTVTGMAELAGAVGLLLDRTRTAAGIGLALLFIMMFPANVYAARKGVGIRGRPPTPLLLRTLMQVIFVSLAVWVAIGA